MTGLFISLQRNLNIIGLKLLHELLISRGHDSHLLYAIRYDENNLRALESLKAFIESRRPALIGMSLTTTEAKAATSLTRKIKEWFPGVPVLWGGVHPTTCPEECVKVADYVCVGEGEQTLLDVAQAIDEGRDLRHINNIGWSDNGALVLNSLYPLVDDLDSFPYAHQVPKNSYIQIHGPVETLTVKHLRKHKAFRGSLYRTITSRGCPHRCSYCCNSYYSKLYPNWGIRHRSAEHVIEEIETAIQEGPPMAYISFMDDCLLGSRQQYLEDFFARYKERIHKPFIAKATPLFVSEARLKPAIDAGLAWIGVGLQSGSERICRDVFQRPISPEVFLRAAKLINTCPIAVYYDVIVDNPFETEEDELATVEVLMRTPKPYFLSLFSLMLYDKAEIREEVLKTHPDRMEDPTTKDLYTIHPTLLNALKFTAMTMPGFLMRPLVARYRRAPDSLLTRVLVRSARFVARVVLQPMTYLWLLLKSQRGSVIGTLRVMPYVFDLRFVSIFNVFDTSPDSTEE
jgi:radical SAM superfamily enzyme YgiQ (UPF0313 family)